MNLLNIYSIRDAKGEQFHAPFYMRTHGEAIRAFARNVRDPQSQIQSFPEDYDLYHLGTFDDQSGKMAVLDTPSHLEKAVNLKSVDS